LQYVAAVQRRKITHAYLKTVECETKLISRNTRSAIVNSFYQFWP